jgi:hypothetical protein
MRPQQHHRTFAFIPMPHPCVCLDPNKLFVWLSNPPLGLTLVRKGLHHGLKNQQNSLPLLNKLLKRPPHQKHATPFFYSNSLLWPWLLRNQLGGPHLALSLIMQLIPVARQIPWDEGPKTYIIRRTLLIIRFGSPLAATCRSPVDSLCCPDTQKQ